MSRLSTLRGQLTSLLSWRPGKKNKTKKYEFEIVVIKHGVNSHVIYTDKSMTHEHEGPDGKKYNIEADNLYRIKPGLIGGFRYRLRGINAGFIILFKEGDTKPIAYKAPAFSARVIKTVHESRALSSALKDEFAKDMNVRTFFMYFILMVAAVVIFLVLTGQIVVG